jgi:hypothetical protein
MWYSGVMGRRSLLLVASFLGLLLAVVLARVAWNYRIIPTRHLFVFAGLCVSFMVLCLVFLRREDARFFSRTKGFEVIPHAKSPRLHAD